MDINKLFLAGKKACGRVLNILPQSEIGSPKKYMMDVLENDTLPSLDIIYPILYRCQLDVSKLIPVHASDQASYIGYRIPLELTKGLEIMAIRNLYTGTTGANNESFHGNNGYLGSASWLSAYPNQYGRYSSANLYETVINAQMTYADMALLGQLQEVPLPRFQSPNILWINSAYAGATSFYVVLCLKNDKNLIYIDDNVYEGIKRLFILDLKAAIYNEYGILGTIDTAFGTIDLKIEDWSGATDQRNDLFDQYHSMAHVRKHSIISG